jgi:sigma-B regulation protein RsbU (phosphoserine phosphatase)
MAPSWLRLKELVRKLGWLDRVFLAAVAAAVLARSGAPGGGLSLLASFLAYVLGIAVAFKWLVVGMRKAIWRLRYRLLVAYAFIAVVPLLLLGFLIFYGSHAFAAQVAVYLVSSELERQTADLLDPARGLAWTPPALRADRAQWVVPAFWRRFPDMEILIRDRETWRYPAGSALEPPPPGWGDTSGLVRKDGKLYFWAHARHDATEVVMLAPVTQNTLDHMLPIIGELSILRRGPARFEEIPSGGAPAGSRMPPAESFLDSEIPNIAVIPVAHWEAPGQQDSDNLLFSTRISAVLRTIFPQQLEWARGSPISAAAWSVALAVGVVFVIVELTALIIGVRLTRTITGAVHNLYRGTLYVRDADFSHRIEVHGDDQLADLSTSFNLMTENLERLLQVAKEKERLQSELEIAREVQNQLFPKTFPVSPTLRLAATCRPARLVSGDYYDYLNLEDQKLALAIGDVAGKGISAALLMATLQSTMRAHLRAGRELAVAAGNGSAAVQPSTAQLVGRLNQQLFAFTSPEKYATFYFAIYDEPSGVLTYTNAGHLPPILVRDGTASKLEVTGTVVGAFAFAQYEESTVRLQPGDLLVCYTDGVTEPENEFGEMFGEDRLTELVLTHASRDSEEIIAAVLESVHTWTGSPELQDDMTLLLARRV